MTHLGKRSLLGLATASLFSPAVQAQGTFPSRPITMIVPFAAGGPTDAVGRLVAQAMSADLGQSVVLENVGGAGGTIGASRVAQARPDGHTLLLHHIGMATTPTLYRRLPYDPIADFEPLGLVVDVPMTLVASSQFPATTMAELIAIVRRDRDRLNYANAGLGSASHLCGLLLQSTLDTAMTTVPFRGTGPAMQELLAGRVDLLCDQTTNTTEQIRGGTIRAFAVTTPARIPSLPGVPTAAEGGLPGLEIAVWHGLYAPRNTPAPIADRLHRALRAALQDPVLRQRVGELGGIITPNSQGSIAAHRAYWEADIAKWRPLIQAAGRYAD